MKRIVIHRLARLSGLAIALGLFAGVSGDLQAQQGQGARTLLELGARVKSAPAPSVSDHKPMACARCKTVFEARAVTESKGLGARTLLTGGVPTETVARHLCEGCGVDWTITGHGKAKQSVATHKCASCGAESVACCNTKKGSDIATKGMEKKFEVAPLK